MAPASVEAIREEMSRILASHEFRASKRSQEFLRYVVEHTLTGRSDTLKERTIGVDVFGRSTAYDPSDDATVRVKAGEVRKRLGLYYATQGARDPVRIELPAGTYVPEFRLCEAEGAPDPLTNSIAAPEPAVVQPPGVRRTARDVKIGVTILVAALAIGAFAWLRMRPSNTVLDQFWAPVLEGESAVSLCAAFVPVYSLDDGKAAQSAKPEDFTFLSDQFVGGGDLIAVSRLAAMLTRMRKPYSVRVGNSVSFHDLRSAPAILVGYSYTRWKEISSEMRYFIDGSRRPVAITDNGAPTQWALPNLPADRHTNEDYAIVSRVFHPDTHAMLVEVAGITQYGTDAAADLVTNESLLQEALRGAPAGWRNKNLQLVLHVKVIAGAPTSPKVVTKHFW
jgi:hypothetical protein